ncbi:serine/threonine-protein kinase [Actinomycetospora sp. CA-084318]|uniref:serine/threonine-protein kinase n=1 Tax=Actinomycetospora sp. CA-084318 TaxID=3239892 RepID=UPI003D985DDF
MSAEKFGNYVLYELLGRGGMGEVHRAYDTVRKRTVALKRLPVSLARDEAFRKRFRTESEVAARLTEPHVLPVHDYGEIDGRLFLDMRYVQGPDLGSLLSRRGGLPPSQAVGIVEQVAAALDAAHADGLVHRDVKPSNVLVTMADADTPSFAYLTDFGVAQLGGADSSLSSTNATAGTFDYMAPERYTSRRADLLVDVYSLGCVLYEVLAGDKPFPATTLPEAMHAHLNQEPPRLAEVRPDVPAGLDDVIARAMAKDPAERYTSCGAVAVAARAALEQATDTPVPQGAVETVLPTPEPAAAAVATAPAVTKTPDDEPDDEPAPSLPPAAPTLVPARRRPRTPVLVGAGAFVAALAVGGAVLVGTGDAGAPAAAAPAAVVGAPAVSPAADTVVPAIADGAYTGRSSGNEVTVALAVKGGKVAAYLCDGKKIEAWLEGTVSGTTMELSNPKGAAVRVDVTETAALGSMTVGGRTLPFSAERSAPPAGLYSARTGTSRVGWIVLADGEQVGTRKDGEVVSPAPALDPAARTTTVDGQTVQATLVEPAPGAGW